MSKIKFTVLFLISNLFLIVNVNAFDLTCDQGTFSYNDSFNCVITDNYNFSYSSISGTIEYTDGINCNILEVGNGLTNYSNDSKKFNLGGYNNQNIILKFSCNVTTQNATASNALFEINDFSYTLYNGQGENLILKSDYIPIKAYKEVEEVDTKPRDISNIESLLTQISDDNLDFTFSRFITKYDISVLYDVSDLNLNIVPYNENATVRVDGSYSLGVGLNVIDIYVTSYDQTSTTCYTLNIRRLPRGEEIYYPAQDSNLKSLTIKSDSNSWDFSPFDSSVHDYSIHLESNQSSVNVNAIANVDTAKINISRTSNLENGDKISITVTSEDTTNVSVYYITVVKDAVRKDYTYIILFSSIIGGIIILVLLILFSNSKKKKKVKEKNVKFEEKINIDQKVNVDQIESSSDVDNKVNDYVGSQNIVNDVNPTVVVPENTQILPIIPTEPKLPQDQDIFNKK